MTPQRGASASRRLGGRRQCLCLYDAPAGGALGPCLAGAWDRRLQVQQACLRGEIAEIGCEESADGLALTVRAAASCAPLVWRRCPLSDAVSVADFQSATPPEHDARPAADEARLRSVDGWAKSTARHGGVSRSGSERHTGNRSTVPEGGHRSSRQVLRCCNWVLSHNVVLPAWMHVGSTVRTWAWHISAIR